MRRVIPLMMLALLLLLLVACRDNQDETENDSAPSAEFTPTLVNATVGCQTADLEAWLEAVLPNAQAFRNESFGVMALPPDQVSGSITRLSDLRDGMTVASVPECAASAQTLLTEMMDIMMTQLVAYSQGGIDQAMLIGEVTTQQGRYDTEIQPALDALLAELEAQYQP